MLVLLVAAAKISVIKVSTSIDHKAELENVLITPINVSTEIS